MVYFVSWLAFLYLNGVGWKFTSFSLRYVSVNFETSIQLVDDVFLGLHHTVHHPDSVLSHLGRMHPNSECPLMVGLSLMNMRCKQRSEYISGPAYTCTVTATLEFGHKG